MADTNSALGLLSTPAILFFILGVAAALVRSDLTVPEAAAKTISLYLMLCIGFKGGVEARAAGLQADFATAAIAGVLLSALMPLLAFAALRRITRLDRATVCAVAATYGSVSVVTFAAGQQHLELSGLDAGGYMAAVLALMETPAILTALLLLRRDAGPAGVSNATVLHEVFTNAASVMLIGSFAVGLVAGEPGMTGIALFVGPLFQGALCFFLLDIGLTAARRMMEDRRKMTLAVTAFAVVFPLVSAAVALGLARLVGLSLGDAALLVILAGSASYIAVPAAMKIAAPQADPGVFVSASLAITFPFNLTVGIPLYTAAAIWLWP